MNKRQERGRGGRLRCCAGRRKQPGWGSRRCEELELRSLLGRVAL